MRRGVFRSGTAYPVSIRAAWSTAGEADAEHPDGENDDACEHGGGPGRLARSRRGSGSKHHDGQSRHDQEGASVTV